MSRYKKREQLAFAREREKLAEELGGIKDLEKLPNAIVISDPERERHAVLEARKLKIPIVALIDTDGDPTLIDYPVPVNHSAAASIKLIYQTIGEELLVAPAAPPIEEEGVNAATEPAAEAPEQEKEHA
jgi:small subunit ribosomal protein S2